MGMGCYNRLKENPLANKEAVMNGITLSYIQTLVDQLSPLDQARLLQYLTPKITRTVATAYKEQSSSPISTEAKNAWEQFFKIGDSLNALPSVTQETLTETIQQMRR